MKFARLVDIDDDHQILALISKDENDDWRLRITSLFEYPAMIADISFWVGKTGADKAKEAFTKVTDEMLRKLFDSSRKTADSVFARLDEMPEEEIPG